MTLLWALCSIASSSLLPPAADARLQPRDTRLTAAFLLLFACAVAGAVFVAVPRGVSVGEITVKTDRMSWNTTKARAAGLAQGKGRHSSHLARRSFWKSFQSYKEVHAWEAQSEPRQAPVQR